MYAPDKISQEQMDIYLQIREAYHNMVRYYNSRLSYEESLFITDCILMFSREFQIDPRLVMAVIIVESRFNPRAVSRKGAMGLGQLMPGTASMLGVKNPFDIKQNIYGTIRYLKEQGLRWSYYHFGYPANLLEEIPEKILNLMLASYNAGPEAVAKYKDIPPYRETKNYVVQVKRLFKYFVYGY